MQCSTHSTVRAEIYLCDHWIYHWSHPLIPPKVRLKTCHILAPWVTMRRCEHHPCSDSQVRTYMAETLELTLPGKTAPDLTSLFSSNKIQLEHNSQDALDRSGIKAILRDLLRTAPLIYTLLNKFSIVYIN